MSKFKSHLDLHCFFVSFCCISSPGIPPWKKGAESRHRLESDLARRKKMKISLVGCNHWFLGGESGGKIWGISTNPTPFGGPQKNSPLLQRWAAQCRCPSYSLLLLSAASLPAYCQHWLWHFCHSVGRHGKPCVAVEHQGLQTLGSKNIVNSKAVRWLHRLRLCVQYTAYLYLSLIECKTCSSSYIHL